MVIIARRLTSVHTYTGVSFPLPLQLFARLYNTALHSDVANAHIAIASKCADR